MTLFDGQRLRHRSAEPYLELRESCCPVEEPQSQLSHQIDPLTPLLALDQQIDVDRVSDVAEKYQCVPTNDEKRQTIRICSSIIRRSVSCIFSNEAYGSKGRIRLQPSKSCP